ncbi:MAG: VWA domain-containing protein, partial [Thermoanaerobaculia bacterium]
MFALLLAANAAAQFRETIEVRVLEIEATVLDRQGHPVEGLTREDFAVEIDGKPAEITSFYPVKRGATGSQPVSGAPVVAMPTRLVIIIDDLHLHPASKQHALVGLREYIERSMDPWTTAMIVTWNGNTLSARAKPTTKRETLLAALDQIAQELPRGMEADADRSSMIRMCQADSVACRMQLPHFGESRASDTDRTVRALQEVIASAGGMEGRKVVLYVS